jgi:NSS family neurotransmitter:Na+ symporter
VGLPGRVHPRRGGLGRGPGLVFIVIPNVFGKIPLGQAFGTIFFLLLILAALTSTISLLEVVTAYVVDEWKWSRARASLAATLVTFLMGVPSALSTGALRPLGSLYKAGGKDQGFLDLMDLVFGNLSLVVGALFIALFTGWAWKRADLFKEVTQSASPAVRALLWAWYVLVKVLCPLGILTILGNLIYSLVRA